VILFVVTVMLDQHNAQVEVDTTRPDSSVLTVMPVQHNAQVRTNFAGWLACEYKGAKYTWIVAVH
jgi:hypothetical protein